MQACVFDLDGTLVDTLPTVHYYCNETLAHFGLGPVDKAEIQGLCRLPIHQFYPRLLLLSGCPEDRVAGMADAVRQRDLELYLRDCAYLAKPFPGIPELLTELGARGVVTAVLTNKPATVAEKLMEHLFPGAFRLVRGQTVESISKPDPRSLWNLLDDLGVTKAECVYVGDTDVDMRTAKSAGVAAAAVGWGYQSLTSLLSFAPEYSAVTPADLLPLFPSR